MKNQHLLTSRGVGHKNKHNRNKNTLAHSDLTPLSAEALSLALSVWMGVGCQRSLKAHWRQPEASCLAWSEGLEKNRERSTFTTL